MIKVNKMAYRKRKIRNETKWGRNYQLKKKNNKGKIRGETMCSTEKG